MTGSPGALLLVLFGVLAFVAYMQGRLDWLFSMGAGVSSAYHSTPPTNPNTTPSSTSIPPTTGARQYG
jgi:hypothetical protein